MQKIFLIIMATAALAACDHTTTYTYAYLTQHPYVLRDKVADCQNGQKLDTDKAKQCEVVLYAAANFMTIVNEAQENPEKFGQKVLEAQTQYAKTKLAFNQAEQKLADLQAKHASVAALKTTQDKLTQLEVQHTEQLNDLQMYLAVLSMSSPE